MLDKERIKIIKEDNNLIVETELKRPSQEMQIKALTMLFTLIEEKYRNREFKIKIVSKEHWKAIAHHNFGRLKKC